MNGLDGTRMNRKPAADRWGLRNELISTFMGRIHGRRLQI